MADKYKQTIEVYEKLGKSYLKQIERLKVTGIDVFMKGVPKGGRILDVGCAGGRDSKIFANNGFKVTGIDLVEAFLREARKKVRRAKFIKMDVRKLKFPEKYFDAVWANAVLVHIYKQDIPQALKSFYKVLKSGGRLHIRMKKGKGMKEVSEKLSLYKKRIFIYLSEVELEKLVKKAGFKILKSKLYPDELGRKEVKWIGILAEKS